MKEQWKPCHDGYYEVSNHGRVRRAKGGRWATKGRVRRPSVTNKGYLLILLYVDGKYTPATVHRLVAAAFLGPCPDGLQVNHIDGDKLNNHAVNLEYVTHAENVRHATRNGLYRTCYQQATIDEVKRLRLAGWTYDAISNKTGMSASQCSNVCNGRQRTQGETNE